MQHQKKRKMKWIEKRIEFCNKKIKELQDRIKSYESILTKKVEMSKEKEANIEERSLMASEIIELFPELLNRSRTLEISIIKAVATMEILSLGIGVYDASIMLSCDHSTIISRRRTYYNLIGTKDPGILRGIEIVQNRMNGIPSDYPFYEKFTKFIKNKYKDSKVPRYIDIALVSLLKEKIYFNDRICYFFGKSDDWIRAIMYSRKELNYNEQYLNIEKMINLDFENFRNYENE